MYNSKHCLLEAILKKTDMEMNEVEALPQMMLRFAQMGGVCAMR